MPSDTCAADSEKEEDGKKGSGKDSSGLVGGAHGALYQLGRIASHLAAGKTIIGIEKSEEVQLYIQKTAASSPRIEWGKPVVRNMDIVLANGDDDLWVEVKSYTKNTVKSGEQTAKNVYRSKINKDWKKIKQKDSGGIVRRQFTLDRVHAAKEDLGGNPPNRMLWEFQDFTMKATAGCKEGKKRVGLQDDEVMKDVHKRLNLLPTAMQTKFRIKGSLGKSDKAEYEDYFKDLLEDIVVSEKIVGADLLSEIKDHIPLPDYESK